MDEPNTPPDENRAPLSRRKVLTSGAAAAAAAGLGVGAYSFGMSDDSVLAVDLIGWMATNITIEDDDGEVTDIYINTDNLTVEVEWANFVDDTHEIDIYLHFALTGNYDGDASDSEIVASTTGKYLGEGHDGKVAFTGNDFDGDGIDGASLFTDHSDMDASMFNVRDEDRDGYYERQRQVEVTLEVYVYEGTETTHTRDYDDTFIVTVDETGGVVEAGGEIQVAGDGT